MKVIYDGDPEKWVCEECEIPKQKALLKPGMACILLSLEILSSYLLEFKRWLLLCSFPTD